MSADPSNYFITPTPERIRSALESWSWLDLAAKRPLLVTAFGDVFFESAEGIWFLDTLEGALKKVCATSAELPRLWRDNEGKDRYLLAAMIDRAVREGHVLRAGECYDWTVHPILGAEANYANITKRDFKVALHLRGQLLPQVLQLPAGKKTSEITVDEPKHAKTWWKFWE